MNKKNDSIRYIVIYEDGSTVPDVEKHQIVIIYIQHNDMKAGKYNRKRYLNSRHNFLVPPKNIFELQQELHQYVQQQLNTSRNANAVAIACPANIAAKMIW